MKRKKELMRCPYGTKVGKNAHQNPYVMLPQGWVWRKRDFVMMADFKHWRPCRA